jgi:hypothetical protein
MSGPDRMTPASPGLIATLFPSLDLPLKRIFRE